MTLMDTLEVAQEMELNNPFLKRSDYLHVFGWQSATFLKIKGYALSCPINNILVSKFRIR